MAAEALFLDSAYPIALASAADQHHAAAARIAASLEEKPEPIITTRAVLLEIGNALTRQNFRALAIGLLRGFEDDSKMTILPVDDALYHRGFNLFQSRQDKTWSLTDCISFVAMDEHGLKRALTSDQHFEQAGFVAMLRRQ